MSCDSYPLKKANGETDYSQTSCELQQFPHVHHCYWWGDETVSDWHKCESLYRFAADAPWCLVTNYEYATIVHFCPICGEKLDKEK